MKKIFLIIIIIFFVLNISALPAISIKVITDGDKESGNDIEKKLDQNTNIETTQTKSKKESNITTTIITNQNGSITIYNTINIENNNANNNVNTVKQPEEKADYISEKERLKIEIMKKRIADKEKIREKKLQYKKLKISAGRITAGLFLGIFFPGSGFSHYLTGGIWGGFLTNILSFSSIGVLVANHYFYNLGKLTYDNYKDIAIGGVLMFLGAYFFDIIGGPIRAHRYNKKMKALVGLSALKRVNLDINKERYALSVDYHF